MLQLTKRTDYGLIALTHLAGHSGVRSVRSIADLYPIPRRLLAEVLKDLLHSHLVESHRGAQGGYTLARPPGEIMLSEIVEALEGAPSLTSCEGSHTENSCAVEAVCPIRSPIHVLRQGIWRMLEQTALSDLAGWPELARIPSFR
ncbi:MAG: hypothetical protein CMJ89_11250 [Planctomycetes bacterium]|jgi:Rrf2 family protein|nr:hypothetical protein [Planctomycetota bacterium]